MRFICSVALKYLVPRWRQLSVSIISLVSIVVIALVVWLALVFLSISQGVKEKWIAQLLALHPPVRVTPTDAYYQSYYYKIDALSLATDYTTRSIGEKREGKTDPYDPQVDAELPSDFPLADRKADSSLKDLVGGAWEAITAIPGVHPREFETALGNLRLNLVREIPGEGVEETCLSQVSYLTHVDPENHEFAHLLLPPSTEDLQTLMAALPAHSLATFLTHVTVSEVQTKRYESPFLTSLYPMTGTLKGCGVFQEGELIKVVVPQKQEGMVALKQRYTQSGYRVEEKELHFNEGRLKEKYPYLTLDEGICFRSTLAKMDAKTLFSYRDVPMHLEGTLQHLAVSGIAPLRYFEMTQLTPQAPSPFWAYQGTVPVDTVLGDGVVIAKSYLQNGVRLGDTGYVSYIAHTASATQEQRVPIYVAGFYDPGLISFGHKCIFVDPKVTAALRGNATISDPSLGNGIHVWMDERGEAERVATRIRTQLTEKGIAPYWNVQSYREYEFVKPILEQLESDQTLFTLVAIIILLVACSNIVSMLILLVNDKRKEIGVMLALGASPRQIAMLFGLCGCLTGIFGSLIGMAMAFWTLRHISVLVSILNALQGHDAFQSMFYGPSLPTEISHEALLIVFFATLILSLIAGLVPAMKAARVKPTEMLRAE